MGTCHQCFKKTVSQSESENSLYSPQFSEIDVEIPKKHFINHLSYHKHQQLPKTLHRGLYRHKYCPLLFEDRQRLYQRRNKIFKKNVQVSKVFKKNIDQRSSKLVRTGDQDRNITFNITSQSLQHFHCQFLYIFADDIKKVVNNPFIYETLQQFHMRDQFKQKLNRREALEQFQRDKIMKIVNPFPGLRILNLYIIQIQMYEGNLEDFSNLQKKIKTSLDQIPLVQNTIQLGIIQISYHYGFPDGDFQLILLNQLEQFSKRSENSLKITYWAYDNENIKHFKEEIFSTRKVLNIQRSQSSDYF